MSVARLVALPIALGGRRPARPPTGSPIALMARSSRSVTRPWRYPASDPRTSVRCRSGQTHNASLASPVVGKCRKLQVGVRTRSRSGRRRTACTGPRTTGSPGHAWA
jgi:hypothetical protein